MIKKFVQTWLQDKKEWPVSGQIGHGPTNEKKQSADGQ